MNAEMPVWARHIVWIPVQHGSEVFFHCRIDAFGLTAEGVSRSKAKALGYALEVLAEQIAKEG